MTDEFFQFVVAESFDDAAVARLKKLGNVVHLEHCDSATLAGAVSDCDALLVRSAARVTGDVLASAKRLRVIGRGGAGLDNIDLVAARRHGVTVVYTPAASTDAVADLTVGLMLSLIRGVCSGDAAVRAGRFSQARQACVGRELSECSIGIVGLGRIGRAVARRCRHGFDCDIFFNDIVKPDGLDFSATFLEKQELYSASDIVTLHVPLTTSTHHLIDDGALKQFKPGAFLVNTARGEVVKASALIEALQSGYLAGAALDVFEHEPILADDPILMASRTLLTPHIGARTIGGLNRMNLVVDDVVRVLRGERPRFAAPG
ncbi:MAG: hydroxyacid dehydrogenase [Planctomycetes bacterium]|nr:hydroxyacid dehydrogenase [Planctomycetota bacterium]